MTPDFIQHPVLLGWALTAANCETIAAIVELQESKNGKVPIYAE